MTRIKKKKRVAFFCRVSTMDQHSSIQNQNTIFEQWLERNTDCELYKIYEDEGISGAKGYKRVKWLEMLEDGEKGLYDIVLCKSYSRFGRNQTETLAAIKKLRTYGVRCVFLEDNLDSDNDMGKFGLFAWLAEQEAQKASERIKMVWDSFNAEGKIHVTVAPYGYDYDKNTKSFVVNEVEAPIVKEIFNLYIIGFGVTNIANKMREREVPTKNGGKWGGSTIRTILVNEFYIGTLVQGKTRTIDATMKEQRAIPEEEWYRHENSHEAIIDREIFEKVNAQLKERGDQARKYYRKVKEGIEPEPFSLKSQSNNNIFSNLLVCGECGAPMYIKRKKKDNYKPHYNCGEYEKIGLKCGHKSNRINKEALEPLVISQLISLSSGNYNKLKKMEANRREKKDDSIIEKELKALDKKIEEQAKVGNNLVMLYSNGTITELQFKTQNESINRALSNFVKRKEELKHELKKDDKIQDQQEEVLTGFESLLNKPFKQWENYELKEVVESITIYMDKTIKIKVKYFS